MMKATLLTIAVIASTNLSGCSPVYAPVVGDAITGLIVDTTESQESKDQKTALLIGHYTPTEGTADVLHKILGNKTVSVGNFDSFEPGLNKLACRLDGYIRAPLFVPFSDMIRDGMIENIKSAGGYSKESQIVLTGRLNSIDFSSYSGNWTMSLTVTSSNGKSLTVVDKYEFETGLGGQAACNDVRNALMPAVHGLLDKVIRDPGFPSLL